METLASQNDKIWPFEKWPKMKFKEGIKEGAIGGHGPIRYQIKKYIPGELIQFKFINPKGFNGIHQFEISELAEDKIELKHTIDMITRGSGSLTWIIGIRWLHDALLEDLLDKVENQFAEQRKKTAWNFWVKFLRKVLN
ncbi:MAG: hypothetical protein Sapg2KO_40580 [Saprospiraceae bacterium]